MSATRSPVAGDTVVVTGMGAVSALGTGCAAHLQALREGRDGLRPTGRFDTRPYASGIAGTWPAWDGRVQPPASRALPLADSARGFSTVEMALVAGREAWAACGRAGPVGARTALVLGTCFGQGFSLFHQVSEAVAAGLQVTGPVLTLSTACSSSTNAIGLARDLLVRGQADVVLAGGVDTLLREAMAGFSALGVISRDKCAPFGEPYGINLGEGAGLLVLERAGEVLVRGGRPLATVDGYGLSADAHHETTPDPTGGGLTRAIRWALDDAAVEVGAIDHVNAHATGTESNDRSEAQAIIQALGARVPPVPVSALKSFLGHAQGAAGVLELILGILALGEGAVPPTLRLHRPRPGAPADPVPGPGLRRAHVRHALNISAAFGGANAALVYGAPAAPRPQPAPAAPPARVILRGLGLVSPLGTGLDSVAQALAGGRSVAGRVPPLDLGAIVPTADPRGCDPSSLFVTIAAATALRDAGLPPRGARRPDTGLFLAATRMPQESARRCQESLDRHGPAGMSAAAFARMAVNAPAGACAKHLGLRGPTTTLSVGTGSGLAAIASAAAWLAARGDARRLLVAAVDEEADFEGATAALLERLPVGESAPDDVKDEVTVAGWGLAGPADAAGAARAALGDHPCPDGVWGEGEAGRHALAPMLPDAARLPLGFRDLGREVPPGEACVSALAFLLAALALRQRQARSLLLVAGAGRSASVAVLLQRGAPSGGTP